jgi:hypothetical protein
VEERALINVLARPPGDTNPILDVVRGGDMTYRKGRMAQLVIAVQAAIARRRVTEVFATFRTSQPIR